MIDMNDIVETAESSQNGDRQRGSDVEGDGVGAELAVRPVDPAVTVADLLRQPEVHDAVARRRRSRQGA